MKALAKLADEFKSNHEVDVFPPLAKLVEIVLGTLGRWVRSWVFSAKKVEQSGRFLIQVSGLVQQNAKTTPPKIANPRVNGSHLSVCGKSFKSSPLKAQTPRKTFVPFGLRSVLQSKQHNKIVLPF